MAHPSQTGRAVHPAAVFACMFAAVVLSYCSWALAGLHSCGESSDHGVICDFLRAPEGPVHGRLTVRTVVGIFVLPPALVALGAWLANTRARRTWFFAALLLTLVLVAIPATLSFSVARR